MTYTLEQSEYFLARWSSTKNEIAYRLNLHHVHVK